MRRPQQERRQRIGLSDKSAGESTPGPLIDVDAERRLLGALLAASDFDAVVERLRRSGQLDALGGVRALYELRAEACNVDEVRQYAERVIAAAARRRAEEKR